jgi:hypothetical protein
VGNDLLGQPVAEVSIGWIRAKVVKGEYDNGLSPIQAGSRGPAGRLWGGWLFKPDSENPCEKERDRKPDQNQYDQWNLDPFPKFRRNRSLSETDDTGSHRDIDQRDTVYLPAL